MSKFTIFTIILSISMITVVADLAIRDYFKADETQTSVLTDVAPPDVLPVTSPEPPADVPPVPATTKAPASTPVASPAPETPSPAPLPPPSSINQQKITKAGFTATLSEAAFDGKVFQLLDITKTPVDAINFYQLKQDTNPIVSITEIVLRDEIRALSLYSLLQNKTKPYIDLSLNETNAYGDRSFYVNHAKKPDEAFLVLKIGRSLYAFAYVKTYHPQLKELIKLLTP